MMFKSIDEKIKKAGYKLDYKSDTCLIYKKFNEQFKYMHGVELQRKNTKKEPIIQSYQEDSPTEDGFDYMVGLSVKDIKLFVKKIKKLKW